MTESEADQVPPAARWLGVAGLIPFFGLAIAIFIGDPDTSALSTKMLEGYGVAILSFMGGCRWGFAAVGLGQGPTFWPLALSVMPALYGWAMLTQPPNLSLIGLAIGFVGLLVADIVLTRQGGAPPWWPTLRLPLTAGATVSLIIAATWFM